MSGKSEIKRYNKEGGEKKKDEVEMEGEEEEERKKEQLEKNTRLTASTDRSLIILSNHTTGFRSCASPYLVG